MMKLVFLGILLMAGSAGEGPLPARTSPSEAFRLLEDGSSFSEHLQDGAQAAIRCWPAEGNFDCVVVRRGPADIRGAEAWLIHRDQRDRLDRSVSPRDSGYRCAVGLDVHVWLHEAIDSEGRTALDNEVWNDQSKGGPPWPRGYILHLLRRYGDPARPSYVNCRRMRELLGKGGAASLADARLSRRNLFEQ